MKWKTAVDFCHRLSTGLSAGVDLLRLLDSESSFGGSRHRDAVKRVRREIAGGESFATAIATDKYFPRIMTSLVGVGEETGRIERTLTALSRHYQHRIETRRTFLRSIAGPALQLVGGILVISLLIYVLGVLTPAGGGTMPDILGFGLTGASGVLWFWAYLALFFGSIGLVVLAFAKNFAGIHNLLPVIYLIPKFGPAIQTITISRFAWTMALSLDAGLDPIRATRLSLDSTDSDYYRGGADEAEAAIRRGSTLAAALETTELFPDEFLRRIEIAELSGTDAESMQHLADEYDQRAKSAVAFLTGLAAVVIRVLVIVVLVFMIFRLFSTYIGALNGAMQPINARG